MMNQEIPPGYEKIDHHDQLGLFHPEAGVVITVHERDRITRELQDKYRFNVQGAQNQKTFYEGSFQSQTQAEQKVLELAEKHPK